MIGPNKNLLRALPFGALFFTSCVSSSDGDALRRSQAAVEERLREFEAAQAAEAERLEAIQSSTQVVTRTSADTGAEVESFRERIAAQDGAIAELRAEISRLSEEFREQQRDYETRMKKLARRAGIDLPVEEAEIPADRNRHFEAAQTAYEAREFSVARALYRAFVTRYRDDERADDAQFLVGQSYLLEDRPATALGELRRVVSDFAQGGEVPRALFSMGEAFYRLHACTDARTTWEALTRQYPRAPQTTEARTRLRDLSRVPTGYCQSRD